jgi:predicted metal-dependent HD superfamily phosphohydrolase
MHGCNLAEPDRHFNQLARRRVTLASHHRALAHDRGPGQGSRMDALDLVQRCWYGVFSRRGSVPAAAVTVLEETVRAYGQPHRHYHTLDHIAALLTLLGRHDAAVADPDALALATLFHDVVYDPARQDNEEASAAWAAARLACLEFPEDLRAKVARYILATRHDRPLDATAEADLALLLDLDLSILAAPPEDYRAYADAVRCEYAFVPEPLYRPGRRRVLETFLRRERIYLTEPLCVAWEQPARANLTAEIARLA